MRCMSHLNLVLFGVADAWAAAVMMVCGIFKSSLLKLVTGRDWDARDFFLRPKTLTSNSWGWKKTFEQFV